MKTFRLPSAGQAPARITVLGIGLMGRLLGLALARQGHRVQLFDAHGADGSGSAAPVAAAMLAPLAESAVAEANIVRMGQHSLERWPQLLADLKQPVYFQRNGTLIVWHRQDAPHAAQLRALIQKNYHLNPSLPRPEELSASSLPSAEPSLEGRFQDAILLPGEGQLDNRQLLPALVAELEAMENVKLNWFTPRQIGEITPQEADFVLDCRGLGAKNEWSQLRGVRGEVLRVYAPEVELARPTRLLHPRYSLYIAPKENHVFVIGATEIESEDAGAFSLRSAMELMSALYTVHSGFAEARILELNTQCRPTLPNNLPALRWQDGGRVLQVNGLYRHGFMIAPTMMDMTLELLTQGCSPLAAQMDVPVLQDGE